MVLKIRLTFIFILLSFNVSFAQQPAKLSSSEIYHALEKFNFLGNALYIAAHPDDENTRLISYLANGMKAKTTYLSITRGDGGQNLIGPELGPQLGVIRTQELLAARRQDGGYQRFTRAIDFGYSKHPDETFSIWDKEKILSDVVYTIRLLKPDIIVNRFDHRTPGTTHGHHTASAMLSFEAFTLAADPNAFPEQLNYVDVWKPRRLFFNSSWFFYGSQEAFEKADKSNLSEVNVGDYYRQLGLSNGEISALSRSEHKSQGFGSTGSRGHEMEYLEFIKGQAPKPKYKNDLFDGITTNWSRVNGGGDIALLMDQVLAQFDLRQPEAIIPQLIEVQKLVSKIEDKFWRETKLKEINEIMVACAGLFVEAKAEQAVGVPGETYEISIEATNRSTYRVSLLSYQTLPGNQAVLVQKQLNFNINNIFKDKVKIPDDASFSSPYWLQEKGSTGIYTVSNPQLIGLPESPAPVQVNFILSFGGKANVFISRDVIFKSNDRVAGEVYEPFVVMPPATVGIQQKVWIFENNSPTKIPVDVLFHGTGVQGKVKLEVPDGWSVSPSEIEVKSNEINKAMTEFIVTPPAKQSEGLLQPKIIIDGKSYGWESTVIDYSHIPKQTLLMPAEAKAAAVSIKKAGIKIAYLQGAGDEVPNALRQVGYLVTELKREDINVATLEQFDALVLGIRAYNIYDNFGSEQKQINDYVKNGGTVVVQYNTTGGLKSPDFSPIPLQISRDRVTDENSPVRFLNPQHPVLNYPNQITLNDFEGWVQERGLYFPNRWDTAFTPILGLQDPGEPEIQGSLLIGQFGKGHYIYTGLSFFRELPQGVTGAFKLFANLLSLGNENKQP